MTEELRELRISRRLPAKEMVNVVQRLYPKYDKTMQSKCENGREYGIQIRRDAMEALLTEFAPELLDDVKRKRKSGHRLTCRISCRLEDDEYAELKKCVQADGFDTMQEWLAVQVRRYLKRRKNTKQ